MKRHQSTCVRIRTSDEQKAWEELVATAGKVRAVQMKLDAANRKESVALGKYKAAVLRARKAA